MLCDGRSELVNEGQSLVILTVPYRALRNVQAIVYCME